MLMFIENKQQMDMIRQSARDFAQYHIKPYVMEWDEAQIFPIEVFKKLGEHGFMGVIVPEEYGGSGLGYQEYITVLDEISKVCGSIGLSVAAHNSLCTNHILSFASEEQKKRYLPKLATAEWIGAWGLTETGSGSDAGGMTTFAERDGDHYVLNGSKNFITHAISSSVAVVIARTGLREIKKGCQLLLLRKVHLDLPQERKKINWGCAPQKLPVCFLIIVGFIGINSSVKKGRGLCRP